MNRLAVRTAPLPPARGVLSQNWHTLPASTAALAPTQAAFIAQIRTEFIEGSAIAPDLFTQTVAILADYAARPGGDFSSPLYEALNWHYTRFGHQARANLYAAAFLNEDGSVWQAKLSSPRTQKGKLVKYEAPVGSGSKPYLPPLTPAVRQAIAHRYYLDELPPQEHFWAWLASHPEIPIVITEGGKKALCLLSQGYVAIGLYGVDGGARAKDALSNRCKPYLIPELLPFLGAGRPVILAFDQDSKLETRSRVKKAIIRLTRLLEKQGGTVLIAAWDGRHGKGVDDLIVNEGMGAWEAAYQAAATLDEWLSLEKLLVRLTHTPAQVLHTADLSLAGIEGLPTEGIVAIASAKGTGKTKAMGTIVQNEAKALVATHRICLGRNLCERIGVHWRGDLDKANGEFIHGGGYTLRVGFCVDSLLAIDPERFRGCVIVIDEVVQVLRHLLTSATCRKDGKLPVLLSRLRQLLQVAQLVMVADADLNNATLRYLHELRGDGQPVHLVRNEFQPAGYPCEFILSPNASAAVARLFGAIGSGERVFVATDSKNQSKHLAHQCYRMGLTESEVLLLNSETSGGEQEQVFITNPDQFLENHPQLRVVIASPSLATGVSIESNYFDSVVGLFWGASLGDADMAQGLMRVRPLVPRIVWCAERGGNFSKVSRATFAGEIIHALKTQTDLATSIIRSSLREDVREAIAAIDWQGDPHLKLFAQITAETNAAMWHLRSALLARLRLEGHQIRVVNLESDPMVQAEMQAAKAEILQREAEAVAAAPLLSAADYLVLEAKESITAAERLSLVKTTLADFYGVQAVTPELVLADKSGLRRARLLALEHQIYPETAQRRDIQALERQMSWHKGICPWDISMANLKREVRARLGLERYLDPTYTWTKYDNVEVAGRARACAEQVKLILGLGNLDALADTQIVHQLLSQMGLKVTFHWSSGVPGYEGEKLRVYRLDLEVWQESLEILTRRAAQRAAITAEVLSGSPPAFLSITNTGGDPAAIGEERNIEKTQSNWDFYLGELVQATESHQDVCSSLPVDAEMVDIVIETTATRDLKVKEL